MLTKLLTIRNIKLRRKKTANQPGKNNKQPAISKIQRNKAAMQTKFALNKTQYHILLHSTPDFTYTIEEG